jgi:hypothetical protein
LLLLIVPLRLALNESPTCSGLALSIGAETNEQINATAVRLGLAKQT